MRAWWLAAVALATPAVAADQFDLVCVSKKEAQRYRIDLSQGEWCAASCQRIMKIKEVTSGMLTLAERQPSPPENVRSYNRINRFSGEWEWYFYDPVNLSTMDIKGVCSPDTFSGMNDADRKF